MTMGIAQNWRKLVADMQNCIQRMKKDPSLNSNKTIATYGMTASIPDPRFLNDMLKIHSAAVLDALE